VHAAGGRGCGRALSATPAACPPERPARHSRDTQQELPTRALRGAGRSRNGRTGTAPPPRTVDNSWGLRAGTAPPPLPRHAAGVADAHAPRRRASAERPSRHRASPADRRQLLRDARRVGPHAAPATRCRSCLRARRAAPSVRGTAEPAPRVPPRSVDNSCGMPAGAAPTRLARPGAGVADARRAPPSLLGRHGTGTAPPPRTVDNSCDVLAGAGDRRARDREQELPTVAGTRRTEGGPVLGGREGAVRGGGRGGAGQRGGAAGEARVSGPGRRGSVGEEVAGPGWARGGAGRWARKSPGGDRGGAGQRAREPRVATAVTMRSRA